MWSSSDDTLLKQFLRMTLERKRERNIDDDKMVQMQTIRLKNIYNIRFFMQYISLVLSVIFDRASISVKSLLMKVVHKCLL